MPLLETAIAPRARLTYDALRARIAASARDVPLPSVADIRAELGVGQATVEKALALLESQGLIERKRSRGVFVADRMATGEVAIVLNRVLMEPGASPAYGLACSRLRRDLHDFSPRWLVKLHLGSGDVAGPELPNTLDLLEPTVLPRLRGVLSFHPLLEMDAKLVAVGVPVIYLGAGPAWGDGVFLDDAAMIRDGIRHLAEAGCRDVRFLNMRYTECPAPDSYDRGQPLAAAGAECGLRFKEEWIICERGWTERQGYDLFMRLWRAGERPDGVLVADDVLCHGVLRAIQELRLELPRDLRLVTHASSGVGFPYPRAVSRMEYDVDEWVDKAVRLLETRSKGPPSPPRAEYVKAKWIQGETT